MKKNIMEYTPAAFNWFLTAIQTKEVLQYINLILAILTTLVSIGYTIYKWYRKATEDGKITEEEVNELKEDIKEELK